MANLIPAGTYLAAAVPQNVQFGTTKGGKEQIVIPFRIIDGDQCSRTITYFGTFGDRAYKHTMSALRNCGWRGNDLSAIGDLPNQVELVVEHDTYDGKTSAKIRWVNIPGGGKIKLSHPMDSSALRQFAAAMRARAGEVAEVAGVPVAEHSPSPSESSATSQAPPPAEQGGPGAFDDVPF